MLKIATWNVNSIRVRLPQVLDWLVVEAPDIVALQETKIINELFPAEEFRQAGYQSVCNGQKTYNGVAFISKTPASDMITDLPTFHDLQKRLLYARFGDLAIVNLYIPNGMAVGSDKYAYKLDWLTHLQQFLCERLDQMKLLVVLGDFNIAPADEDVHDPAAWQGSVLVSPAERAHFFQFIDKGLVDCYRLFKQEENSFTWWDYRAAGFARNRGLRIDHILASRRMAELCRICRIDTSPRKLERPSDHAPVVAVFDL